MRNTSACAVVAALAAGTVLVTAVDVEAQTTPACTTLVPQHAVYVAGSTAVQPVLQKLAQALSTATPPITIVYQAPASCVGLGDVISATPATQSAVALNADGTTSPCTPPAAGTTVDIGVSDVFPATCGLTLGAGQKEYLGPVQIMTMVVPKASNEVAISADAAYVVFGFGGQAPNQVAPWTDSTQMFIRAPTSGTINMIGTAIGLPATKWLPGAMYTAQHLGGSGAVLTALQGSTSAASAIGILAADFGDQHRDTLRILAYQHSDQECGYLPDSSATTFDKINVRQGRYAIWGPVHFVTNVDGAGNPMNPDAATVLNYFTGTGLSVMQKQAVIQAEANAYTIPSCAMQVTRSSEIGAEASFQPTEPCGCYYESLKGTVISKPCTPCPMGNECSAPTPTCRYGYCEAQ